MKTLLPVYRQIDKKLSKVVAKQPYPSPCKKGCDACCHGMQVTVHLMEALEICSFLGRRHGVEHLKSLGPELYRQALELAQPATSAAAWKSKWEPCPLLKDSLCTAYLMRPLQCRAWISLDDVAKCSQVGSEIRALDNTWPSRNMLVPLQNLAKDNGFPPSSGPLQFQMLLAMLIMTIGKDAYAKRVRGTTLNSMLSVVAWMHFENEDPRRAEMTRHAWGKIRETGVRYLRPTEVLDWPEMRELGGVSACAPPTTHAKENTLPG